MEMKQLLLQTAIQKHKEIAGKISHTNLEEVHQEMKQNFAQFRVMQSYLNGTLDQVGIPNQTQVNNQPNNHNINTNNPNTLNTLSNNPTQEPTDEELLKRPNHYKFIRDIVGGYVDGLFHGDRPYKFPETYVKRLKVENGAILKVVGEEMQIKGLTYKFEIVKKLNEPNFDRREINDCIIAEQSGKLYIESTKANKPLHHFDGFDFSSIIFISDKDRINWNLRAGNIVDICYNVKNPNIISVIMNHSKLRKVYA
ncbi:hypothetical protein bcgnr5378_36940 [Bacillus cereus]|uniref:Uncharacterized protein n=1 Tax=Bacillus cereus TaxID=1396 RepID=A0A161TA50_BACCE|nr:hypothetical protein [Bacillus cereus]KZD71974.1 hypothetical protein B4088_0435 [Bacillus cereus]HDR8322076.1 hypothetical protein [Bacillus cereus]HDR8328626.1 hypothetical protein [Bacillus cereus]HDR8334262.1 hypothetical protein [Bacillus cereus]